MYRRYTQQELCNAVYCTVFNSTEPLTRLGICRAMGRAKSPHIVAMIEQLRDAGWLVESEGIGRNGARTLFYTIGRYIEIEQVLT